MHSLKDETVYKLAGHAVGAITLDCGYHLAHRASLDILTDVCCDYLRKIATLLRLAKDTEGWRDGDSDFVDSLERVFHQINIPSAANLHQFICKMEAIKKHQQQSCNDRLQQSSGSEPGDCTIPTKTTTTPSQVSWNDNKE